MNLDGFVKLTPDQVMWFTDEEGEPYWKPKNPEPGKSYCLVLPPTKDSAFKGEPLFQKLR